MPKVLHHQLESGLGSIQELKRTPIVRCDRRLGHGQRNHRTGESDNYQHDHHDDDETNTAIAHRDRSH